MFIYNVTVSVNHSVEDDWINWMKNTHIPEVMKTGFFTEYKMFKVLLNTDENSRSYSVQYAFSQMKDLQLYQANFATALQQKHIARYADKCHAFRSVLEKMS
jgi:threonyl-tRNA synthetase